MNKYNLNLTNLRNHNISQSERKEKFHLHFSLILNDLNRKRSYFTMGQISLILEEINRLYPFLILYLCQLCKELLGPIVQQQMQTFKGRTFIRLRKKQIKLRIKLNFQNNNMQAFNQKLRDLIMNKKIRKINQKDIFQKSPKLQQKIEDLHLTNKKKDKMSSIPKILALVNIRPMSNGLKLLIM